MSDSNQDKLNMSLERAVANAKSHSHEYVTIEHMLYAILGETDVSELFTKMGVNTKGLSEELEDYLNSRDDIVVPGYMGEPKKTLGLDRLFNRAVAQVIFSGNTILNCRDLVVSALSEKQSQAYYLLAKHGASRDKAVEVLHDEVSQQIRGGAQQPPMLGGGQDKPVKFEDFVTNLNVEASEGRIDPVIGREEELINISEVLARRKKNNVIIVGEPGVGKTAIAEGLALMITEGQVPEALEQKEVYSLDVTSMVAGTKFRGDFEERAKMVFDQLSQKDNAILFIDEIHMIMGAGSAGGSNLDVANLLKPLLASGKLLCIGATTNEEYRENFEKDRALQRRFQRMIIDQPDNENTKKILRGLRQYYELFHEITYEDDALDLAVDLAERFIHNKFNPDRAIDVIDVAGARAKLHKNATVITEKEIREAVSKITKIPLNMIDVKENANFAKLEDSIRAKLFGQDTAVETLVEAILVSKSGMRPKNKPMGSFLFVGPTGTGKTELCRQLADNMDIKLHKYDMSEYMEQHSVSKLIGAPPGYVGHAEGGAGAGQLINDLDENPNSIILLDEVEKAHRNVMNLLLQVMDDGKLTSSTGKVADFSNAIIVMTSNLGAAQKAKKAIGFNTDNEDATMVEVNKFFSPEFRNRLDAVVEFNRLEKQHIDMIVGKSVNELNDMLKDKGVYISLTDEAREWLRERGYDPEMGARPLQRVIHDNIKKPLSKEILFGKLSDGGSVMVGVENDKLTFVFG